MSQIDGFMCYNFTGIGNDHKRNVPLLLLRIVQPSLGASEMCSETKSFSISFTLSCYFFVFFQKEEFE
jgi:hypothetical protein